MPEDPADAEGDTFKMTGEQLRARLMDNFSEMGELEVILDSDTFQVPMDLLGGDDD